MKKTKRHRSTPKSKRQALTRRTKREKIKAEHKPEAKGKMAEHFAAWKSGTSMSALVRKLGMKRRDLKRAFIKLAGSKDQFKVLRAAGAGGSAFGGKRGGGRTKERIALDDSKVPVIQSKDIKLKLNDTVVAALDGLRGELYEKMIAKGTTKSERMRYTTGHDNAQRIVAQAKTDAKWKGWCVEHYPSQLGTALRLISPDGKHYVRATPTERADCLVKGGLGMSRWKVESEARLAKKLKQEDQVLKRGLKAHKHRSKVKKAKRAARRAAKSSTK